ncbi:hypothetical protein HMPREF1550_00423 [Actinomyces sp. oral taxon 877 str. F0543]|nr:hypothetical protein HMPREF1550_00423 [Actinomyces sp. oral taxon 877 str. F0543]
MGSPFCSVVFEDVVVAGQAHRLLFAAQLGHARGMNDECDCSAYIADPESHIVVQGPLI